VSRPGPRELALSRPKAYKCLAPILCQGLGLVCLPLGMGLLFGPPLPLLGSAGETWRVTPQPYDLLLSFCCCPASAAEMRAQCVCELWVLLAKDLGPQLRLMPMPHCQL